MFRNARIYKLKSDWPATEEAAAAELEKAAFAPCGPLTERSSGWVEIDINAGDSLVRRLNGADLLKLRSQSRVLPVSVVNEALEDRLDEWQQRMEEKPGRSVKRRLKAETREELLPKALLKSDKLFGYVDLADKLVVVDTSSETNAERFLQHMRLPFGELVMVPLRYKQPVGDLLTKIFLGDAPRSISLGRECRMQDAVDVRSTVRWNDFDLTDKSIRSHVADGMRLTHLGIEYDNLLSCVISDQGILSKIKLLGADDADTGAEEDPLARFDAEFVLMSSALRGLLGELKTLLGGYDTGKQAA
jgi:recombination associated protein RdgC